MEPMQTAGLQEARKRISPTFHQNVLEAPRGQRRQNPRRRYPPRRRRQTDVLDVCGRRWPMVAKDNALGTVFGQTSCGCRQTALEINHHARRLRGVGPQGCTPHRQLRIVGHDRADSDHHRVDQSPQAVQVNKGGVAVDVMGVPGSRGDSAIKGLP